MNRREAISAVAYLLGGTVIGSSVFLTGCASPEKKVTLDFTPENIAFLDEVADTIIPATKTPGAKAAKVGQFMTVMVKDCYEEKNQKIFLEGFNKLDKASDDKFKKAFMELDAAQKKELLTQLDQEQRDYMKKKSKDDPSHYFRMMKELTLLGYFTSEIGATQALRYVETPGRFDPCLPYKKGDKAWA